MATAITKVLADTYFTTHIEGAIWTGFSDDLRTRAIAHAKEILHRHFGIDMLEQDVDTDIRYYPDRAVYEQALFMLRNSDAVPNGELTASHWLSAGRDGEVKQMDSRFIAPEAYRWLLIAASKPYLMRSS
jgi:hypothetical protein